MTLRLFKNVMVIFYFVKKSQTLVVLKNNILFTWMLWVRNSEVSPEKVFLQLHPVWDFRWRTQELGMVDN